MQYVLVSVVTGGGERSEESVWIVGPTVGIVRGTGRIVGGNLVVVNPVKRETVGRRNTYARTQN